MGIGGFRQVIQKEGAGALLTGAGPTFAGYFLQGAFKFGGYEFFKQQSISLLGYEHAVQNRTAVYLASSACAEFFADIALCPLEATRIRLVSEPTYASGLVSPRWPRTRVSVLSTLVSAPSASSRSLTPCPSSSSTRRSPNTSTPTSSTRRRPLPA